MDERDLNIDNYNISELFQLFHINESYSKEIIKERLAKIVKTIKKSDTQYIYFLKNVETKLLNYINPDRKPTNYDIINNISSVSGGEHAITKDKVIPTQNVYNYKFPVGVINPIEKRTITKILCLDTLLRQNYETTSSSNFIWTLPLILNNVISMKLISLQLPYQWHMFCSFRKSNQFTIHLFNMKNYPDSSQRIIIPDGNYISNTFENTLNSIFMNLGNGLQYLHLNINTISSQTIIRAKTRTDNIDSETYTLDEDDLDNINCPYDSTSEDYSPNFYFVVDFVLDNEGCIQNNNRSPCKNAGWMMGFRKDNYTVISNNAYINNGVYPAITYQGYLQSEGTYGSSIWKYVFLEIDDFNKNFVTNSIVSPLGDSYYLGNNIMARISVPCGQYALINDNSSDLIFKTREYFGPVTINKLQIKLLNKFGDIINLLENDYSFALEITILYN